MEPMKAEATRKEGSGNIVLGEAESFQPNERRISGYKDSHILYEILNHIDMQFSRWKKEIERCARREKRIILDGTNLRLLKR